MRVCIIKNSGRVIEAQSNDGASLKPLIQNALAAGYKEFEIETKVIPDEEFYQMLAMQESSEKTYCQKRAAEYPPIGDQLDALWKGGADADEMKRKVQSIKNKYPKV